MKKILALTLTLAMILTSFAAFADDFDDLYEAIENTTANAKMAYTVSFELNDTLDFLKIYKIPYMEFIDAYNLTEDLFDTSSEVNAKIISSNNFKKADMYMDITFNAPITVNPDLKLAAWGKMYYWITYDFTDNDNPILKYVVKTPTSDKYQVLDCSESSEMTEMLSVMDYSNIIDTSKELLKKYSTVEKTDSGYIMSISPDNAKLFMFDILDNVSGMYKNEFVEIMDAYDPFEKIKDYLDENNLFGDEGLVAVYNVDDSGNITSGSETVDLSVSFPWYNEETDEETVETVKFKVYTNYTFENDGVISIDFPELTEENSINLADVNGGYEPVDYMHVQFEGVPYEEGNTVYYPLRPVLNGFNVDNENILFDNGTVIVTSDDEYTDFSELKLVAGNNEVIKDGVSVIVENGVTEHNDRTYISEEFIEKVLNSSIDYNYTDYYSDKTAITSIDLSRETLTGDYNIYDYYSDYVPRRIYLDGGGSKDSVIIRNDTHYFKLDELIDICGLSKDAVNVYENSTYVKYGDYEITLSEPVIKENDNLYVPSYFVYDVLGCEVDYVDSDGDYSISYENPDYVPGIEPESYTFTDWDYPYSDGEMYIPYELFAENTKAEVDLSRVVNHNGKNYLPSSYITDELGYEFNYFDFYFENFTPMSSYTFIK